MFSRIVQYGCLPLALVGNGSHTACNEYYCTHTERLGIVPMYQLLQQEKMMRMRNGDVSRVRTRIILVYVNRTHDDVWLYHELRNMAKQYGLCRLILVFTQVSRLAYGCASCLYR
jgi:hypothetical protein